jgi:chromosomal replication initiator protein
VPPAPPESADDDLDAVWGRVMKGLAAALPASTLSLWLEPLRPVSARGETVYLSAPPTVKRWVERRYLSQVEAELRRQADGLTRAIVIEGPEHEQTADVGSPQPIPEPLDPTNTFEQFVIGPGNRLAQAAALAVAELPGEAYNPLFLHGPPGLGKTHLLGAIVDYLARNHPELNVHYTTAERFTSEFVSALRHDGPELFKHRYRELDALLIDDVQVLEGKQRTEEEFVHTFNALHGAGKQIVLSSDRPPGALSRLEQRLRDRFDWGLTVGIEPPDLRTRVTLLWRIAADASPELEDPRVLCEIAARASGNVRLLEGAMTRVVAIASVLSEPISLRLVRSALELSSEAPEGGPAEAGAPSVRAIQEAVSGTLRVSREELLSNRRTPRVARARQLAMYLTRELTPLSLAQIAREFNRDHSTVLHAIRAVAQRLEPGSETADAIQRVHRSLGMTNAHQPMNQPSTHGRLDNPPTQSTP